jgi:hypothetical protein
MCQGESIKPAVLEEEAAATYIGMSVMYLRRSRCEGHRDDRTPAPPYIKIGRSVRYLIEDLDEFLKQNRHECL